MTDLIDYFPVRPRTCPRPWWWPFQPALRRSSWPAPAGLPPPPRQAASNPRNPTGASSLHLKIEHCTPSSAITSQVITIGRRGQIQKGTNRYNIYLFGLFSTPLRNAKASGWTARLANSSAAFPRSLYIVAKTKKHGVRASWEQQQTAVSLALSAQLMQVRFSSRKLWENVWWGVVNYT